MEKLLVILYYGAMENAMAIQRKVTDLEGQVRAAQLEVNKKQSAINAAHAQKKELETSLASRRQKASAIQAELKSLISSTKPKLAAPTNAGEGAQSLGVAALKREIENNSRKIDQEEAEIARLQSNVRRERATVGKEQLELRQEESKEKLAKAAAAGTERAHQAKEGQAHMREEELRKIEHEIQEEESALRLLEQNDRAAVGALELEERQLDQKKEELARTRNLATDAAREKGLKTRLG